jgi:hypothetical protein
VEGGTCDVRRSKTNPSSSSLPGHSKAISQNTLGRNCGAFHRIKTRDILPAVDKQDGGEDTQSGRVRRKVTSQPSPRQ